MATLQGAVPHLYTRKWAQINGGLPQRSQSQPDWRPSELSAHAHAIAPPAKTDVVPGGRGSPPPPSHAFNLQGPFPTHFCCLFVSADRSLLVWLGQMPDLLPALSAPADPTPRVACSQGCVAVHPLLTSLPGLDGLPLHRDSRDSPAPKRNATK